MYVGFETHIHTMSIKIYGKHAICNYRGFRIIETK
jgi:hypothetical protein